jgi:hypothetical protein
MKNETIAGLALTAALSLGFAHAQVGQDLKNAGHSTADATRTAAHDTAHGTKVAAHHTAHTTKHVYHKTAHGTKVAARDTAHGTENAGDRVSGKPATH